jgi:hypothetical protein
LEYYIGRYMSFDNFEDIAEALQEDCEEGGPSYFIVGYFNSYEDIRTGMCVRDLEEMIEVLYDQIAILEDLSENYPTDFDSEES